MRIEEIREPWIQARRCSRRTTISAASSSCARTGAASRLDLNYVGKRAMLTYDLPLNEVVFDFYDRLKSISKGYASLRLPHHRLPRRATSSRCQILVNAEPVDALSMLVHRDRAEMRGRAMVDKLKDLIPPHLFQIPVQAAIGGKIIARETIRALAQGRDRQVLRRRRRPASASCWKSRRRARRRCGSSARSRSRRKPSSRR